MYEFYINTEGNKFLVWQNLTLEEAITLEELTVKLSPDGWKTSQWYKVIPPPTYERRSIDND